MCGRTLMHLAMIFYKDIRTPGRLEAFYKEAQNDPGVMLTKGDVHGVVRCGKRQSLR